MAEHFFPAGACLRHMLHAAMAQRHVYSAAELWGRRTATMSVKQCALGLVSASRRVAPGLVLVGERGHVGLISNGWPVVRGWHGLPYIVAQVPTPRLAIDDGQAPASGPVDPQLVSNGWQAQPFASAITLVSFGRRVVGPAQMRSLLDAVVGEPPDTPVLLRVACEPAGAGEVRTEIVGYTHGGSWCCETAQQRLLYHMSLLPGFGLREALRALVSPSEATGTEPPAGRDARSKPS